MFEYTSASGTKAWIVLSKVSAVWTDKEDGLQVTTAGYEPSAYIPAAHAEAFIEALREEVGRG